MELVGDMGPVEARFSPFGDIVKLKCKTGAQIGTNIPYSGIILGTNNGTPR
jgi:hypothetical protein